MNINRFAQLIIYDRDGRIKTVAMNQPRVTIGREKPGSTCDVQLASDVVSSNHGIFSFYNGEYYYVDGVNLNGTYVNGQLMPKEQGKMSKARKLRDGDILTIGVKNQSKERTVYILFSTSTGNDYIWNACSLSTFKKNISAGRDINYCDIVIPEPTVSRRHAIISIDDSGRTFVTDCKSTCGTLLNGNAIKSGRAYPFSERDTITIGSTKIIHFGNAVIYCKAKPVLSDGSDIDPNIIIGEMNKTLYVHDKPVINPQILNQTNKESQKHNIIHSRKGGVELRVENLTKTVPCKKGTGINGSDKKNILENVSLTIYPGELVAILGGSGAGKTTLMNAINGFEPATRGSVYINGNDLYKNYQIYKGKIGYVPQQDIVYDNLTMADMLTYVAKLRLPGDFSKDELSRRVDEVLVAMGLEKQKFTLIKKMSGGQKKRASIAVELISDPALFFLDEPTSGLDPEAETNLMKQLQKLSSEKSKTIVVITHTLQNIHLFDKVIFMAPGGKLCFYGSPDEAKKFFSVNNLADAYEKISANIDGYVNRFNATRRQ